MTAVFACLCCVCISLVRARVCVCVCVRVCVRACVRVYAWFRFPANHLQRLPASILVRTSNKVCSTIECLSRESPVLEHTVTVYCRPRVLGKRPTLPVKLWFKSERRQATSLDLTGITCTTYHIMLVCYLRWVEMSPCPHDHDRLFCCEITELPQLVRSVSLQTCLLTALYWLMLYAILWNFHL